MKTKLALIALVATAFIACGPNAPDPDACPGYHRGDTVKVVHGPWKDSTGIVRGVAYEDVSCNRGYEVDINGDPYFRLTLSGGILALWEGAGK